MTRRTPASIAVVALLLLIVADFLRHPPNPYRAPAIVALGSGTASAGGFCGALPD